MRTWPFIALDKDGNRITPHQAKHKPQLRPFQIHNQEVIPAVGAQNVAHWRSVTGEHYSRPGDALGWEMSEWHQDCQEEAALKGLLIEHPIRYGDSLLYADAYDADSNTVVEFVWSHFDYSKINKYFELGHNQMWVFPAERLDKLRSEICLVKECEWQESYKWPSTDICAGLDTLPKVYCEVV